MLRILSVIVVFLSLASCTRDRHGQFFLEKESIHKVINQLFVQTDNRDWEKVRSCFADSVLFDVTSMMGGYPTFMTPKQITDAWSVGLRPLEAIHHQTGNIEIDVSDGNAEVFCYGITFHYLPNLSNQNTRTFVGSYDFKLEKVGGDWKITMFKFNKKFIDGNPHLELDQPVESNSD